MTNCSTDIRGISDNKSNFANCKPWSLTDPNTINLTNTLADNYLNESLDIAGAIVNVFRLLGVHEQNKLVDLTGNGNAISNGDITGFPSLNAFDKFKTEWLSKQSGSSLISTGFIGYDFGIIKLPNGRRRYGIDTSVRVEINTIRIKQSSNPKYRATKVRVERSDDAKQWYGVAILTLPNNDTLNTIHFKNSAPMRYWRLRPIELSGDECDSWGIQALEMFEYIATDISNIQDKILMENRDRDYETPPRILKGYYELQQASIDLQKLGIDMPITYSIKISFTSAVASLTRPIVIGDIIELPSETQYTPSLQPIKKYLEVTDVTWDPGSYTPGWMPTMLLITAVPALASEETQDIFGDLAANIDNSGLLDNNDGNHKMYQDYSSIDQAIKAKSLKDVPELGSEGSNVIKEFTQETIDAADTEGYNIRKIGSNRIGLYVEDAIPANGEQYTEGPTLPANPDDGDYHRLIYEGLSKDVPARLYRYSTTKTRWVYLETDRRQQYNNQKAILEDYLISPKKTPARDIR